MHRVVQVSRERLASSHSWILVFLVSLVYLHTHSASHFLSGKPEKVRSIPFSSLSSSSLDVHKFRDWRMKRLESARDFVLAWHACNSSVFFAYILSWRRRRWKRTAFSVCVEELVSVLNDLLASSSPAEEMFFFQAVLYVSDWVCMSFDSTAMPLKHSRGRRHFCSRSRETHKKSIEFDETSSTKKTTCKTTKKWMRNGYFQEEVWTLKRMISRFKATRLSSSTQDILCLNSLSA